MTLRLPLNAGPVRLSMAALALSIVVNAARAQCQYEVIHIIKAPMCGQEASTTVGIALNNAGQSCGYFAPCPGSLTRPWVSYGPGDFRVLTPPGGTEGAANDIAEDGTVVGYFRPGGGLARGFIYHPQTDTYTVLSPLMPGGECALGAINSKGQVCGKRSLTNDPTLFQAFVWHKGVYTDLGVMNGPRSSALGIADNGVITGWTGSGEHTSNCRGFVLDGSSLSIIPPLEGWTNSVAENLNERGVVIGKGRQMVKGLGLQYRALAVIGGDLIHLNGLPGYESNHAHAINEASEIAGSSSSELPTKPTVWRQGQVYDLTEWLMPHPNVDYVTSAYAINDDGIMLLVGDDGMGDTVAMVTRPVTKTPADLNHDCRVDVDDLLLVIGNWGAGASWADITKDGVVNVPDLLTVIVDWGS